MKLAHIWIAVGLTVAAPAAAQPRTQAPDVEGVARRLVDSSLISRGDWGVALDDVCELLERHPQHPLADAAASHLSSIFEEAEDPAVVSERIAAIDLQLLMPDARRRVERLQGELAAHSAPLAEGDPDFFPTYLRHWRVLGPLPPEEHPRPWSTPSPLHAAPGFDDNHEGCDGAVQWRRATRRGTSPYVDAYRALRADRGAAMLACEFEAGGGPAWIEIEVEFPSAAPYDGRFEGAVPGYSYSLNGTPRQVVEYLSTERSALVRVPVVLRAGVNRLTLLSSLLRGARARFMVRILNTAGAPMGVREIASDPRDPHELGNPVVRSAPTQPIVSSADYLKRMEWRGPASEALLGSLLASDWQSSAGLQHLLRAHEMEPDDPAYKAMYAIGLLAAPHLPGTWRDGRVRALFEEVNRSDPQHFFAARFLSMRLAREDREEEALEMLAAAGGDRPHSDLLRSQSAIYLGLGMRARSEAALERALDNAPDAPRLLAEYADRLVRHGQLTQAAEVRDRLLTHGRRTTSRLLEAAEAHADLGGTDRALALLREAARRDPLQIDEWVSYCVRTERLDEAEALLDELRERYPRLAGTRLLLAAVAMMRGDEQEELEQLRAARELAPESRLLRERLYALTGSEPCEEFLSSEVLDPDEAIASYDDADQQESVVSVIDHSALFVFANGTVERLTQNLYQARDLRGCQALGEIRLQGEVVAIRTIKQDGTRHEPVLVQDSYVMPSLEPGDFVSVVYRTFEPPGPLDQVRTGRWMFQSVERPFHLSRYALAVPEDSELRVAESNVDDVRRERRVSGEHVLYVFEKRESERVIPEPGMPPGHWFLPWVELGTDDDLALWSQFLQADVESATRVTPEVQRAADEAVAGVDGQEEQARALHAFVQETLDKRGQVPRAATEVLLAREGNANHLYLALLKARGIDAEIVFSRGQSRAADEEPDPPFQRANRYLGLALVVVRPDNGPAAWCNLSSRTLPYGELTGLSVEADALFPRAAKVGTTPARPLSDRPGVELVGTLRVHADGSADAEGTCAPLGGLGYLIKEQAEEVPAAQRRFAVSQVSAGALPGIEVQDFELRGLEQDDAPLVLQVSGHVRTFGDADGDGFVARLPLPPMQMRRRFGGEGQRRLPYRLPAPLVNRVRATLVLDEGVTLVEPPPAEVLQCAGGTYTFKLTQEDERTWVLERTVQIREMVVPPEEYPALVEFATAVDNIERARLRFRRP